MTTMGNKAIIYKAYYLKGPKELNPIRLYANDKGLLGLSLPGDNFLKNEKEEQSYKEVNCEDHGILAATALWLEAYFSKGAPLPPLPPLAPQGTTFQELVWKLLLDIPLGELTTYGDLAQKVAKIQKKKHMSAQAIGGAVGRNPISIIIPCHRVIGKDGSLTGYASGLDLKKVLLSHEGHKLETFT